MDVNKIACLSRHAQQIDRMGFYESDGKLYFGGIGWSESFSDRAALKELAKRLNAAVCGPLASVAEALQEEIKAEIAADAPKLAHSA